MRTEKEVLNYGAIANHHFVDKCVKCEGGKLTDCSCRSDAAYALACYEACIPKDFWHINCSDIIYNVEVFEKNIKPYVENMKKALSRGYSLFLSGDNGVGKTMFSCYVLTEAIKKGRTAYFTTMPELDYNTKKGYDGGDKSLANRLDEMLTSDFVVIDELGKERKKRSNDHSDALLERIMKRRLDDSQPMIFSTNLTYEEVVEAYGPTVESMLSGKFRKILMMPGDYRNRIHDKMLMEMGYG